MLLGQCLSGSPLKCISCGYLISIEVSAAFITILSIVILFLIGGLETSAGTSTRSVKQCESPYWIRLSWEERSPGRRFYVWKFILYR